MAKKRPTKKSSPRSASAKSDPRAPARPRAKAKRNHASKRLAKLDQEILELLNRRADLQGNPFNDKGQEAPDYHQDADPLEKPDTAAGQSFASAFQEQLPGVDQLVQENPGPLSGDSVRAIFREIVSGCQAVRHIPQVVFLGPEFTYSHLAAVEQFGLSARLVPVGSILAVFEEVEQGQAEFGLVPVDNSTDGRVIDTIACLTQTKVKMCAEVPLRIRHSLLGSGSRQELKHVYSKPQVLSQCRSWLAEHLPSVELHSFSSSVQAAKKAVDDPTIGAIASRQAGVHYGLNVLAADIQDNSDNLTRFVVIGKEIGPRTGNDKTSIVFEIDHYPGALADAMGIFKRNRLNLTWIESFPVPGSRGRYLFFIEFQGYPTELRPKRALASLDKKALRLDVLGSYAQADPIG